MIYMTYIPIPVNKQVYQQPTTLVFGKATSGAAASIMTPSIFVKVSGSMLMKERASAVPCAFDFFLYFSF